MESSAKVQLQEAYQFGTFVAFLKQRPLAAKESTRVSPALDIAIRRLACQSFEPQGTEGR
jgi:hypothetical protein